MTHSTKRHTQKKPNDITSSKGICCCLIPRRNKNVKLHTTRRKQKKEKEQRNKLSKGSWKKHFCCIKLLCFVCLQLLFLSLCTMSYNTAHKEMCSHVLENRKLKNCTRKKSPFCCCFTSFLVFWTKHKKDGTK